MNPAVSIKKTISYTFPSLVSENEEFIYGAIETTDKKTAMNIVIIHACFGMVYPNSDDCLVRELLLCCKEEFETIRNFFHVLVNNGLEITSTISNMINADFFGMFKGTRLYAEVREFLDELTGENE